jgi:hypothetical protein
MRIRISATLLALALAACSPPQPQEVPSPPARPDNPAPAPEAPAGTEPTDPTTSPAAPVQPAPDAPPPTDPAPAPRPTADDAAEPAVQSMALARPGAKMSVAVDLRYQFDGAVTDGRPATLHLAAIPRVAGTNFNMHVNEAAGLDVAHGAFAAQKVEAAGVYRQRLSVVRHAGAPENLRVLVTMDMPEGTAFGFFTIPLEPGQRPAGETNRKADSVKQR